MVRSAIITTTREKLPHIYIYIYMRDYFYLYMTGIIKPPPRQKSSGDHLGPKIQKYFNKILSTKIIHTSVFFCVENGRKHVQQYI